MSKNSWFQIKAQASDATEILIYDVIGSYWMETDATSIASQIKDLDTDRIVVRINSPGGSAFDGIAIMNALRSHEASVTIRVDGLAASAASVIAMAGDEIIMGPGSQMMIHEAWSYTSGDAAYLRAEADRLDKISDSMATLYARRAKGDVDEWRALVAAETWFTAEEAVTAGLADRVDGDGDAVTDNEFAAAFNLSRFRFAGRSHAPAPRIPSVAAAEANNGKDGSMPTLMEGLRKRLGVSEDADEATTLAALDEVLAEQADDAPPAGTGIEARAGVVAVDADRFASMQSQLAEFEQFRTEQQAAAVTSYLNEAMRVGKFPPAKLAQYEALIKDAPDATKALIDSMPANTFPVAEVGHDGDSPATSDDSARLTALADKSGFASDVIL
ncbi:head maturation protease, ClpP-related [Rhodococcus qingshengii]|uniref:head maturation protease, ClpP-related n=1 Tax=Rhodococcus qingshengii TaxID=334542 RepID=UPI0037C872C3